MQSGKPNAYAGATPDEVAETAVFAGRAAQHRRRYRVETVVTAAIICAVAGLVLLVAAVVMLGSGDRAADWRERTADTAADFRDWLRLGR